jgi:hypothetical protein
MKPAWVVQLSIVAVLLFSAAESFGQILTLTPSLSLSERYDDNIFQDSTGEETDYITIVSPGIQLQYQPSSETRLDLNYYANFEFFARNTEQNQISQRGTLRFNSPISRLFSIAVNDTLFITEDPVERVIEIDEVTGLRPTSQESREQTIRNRAIATLDVLLTARSTLSLLFNSLIEDVEDPDEVDEFRYTVGVELGYLTHVRRNSRLRLFYDVTFHTFSENAPVAPGTEESDFQVHTINVGYRHDFSPTLSGDVAAGYAFTASEDSELDGDTGFVANLGLTKALRTGEIAFRYRRTFTSGHGEAGVVLADVFTVAASSGLTPKITASLSSNLSFFNFQQREEDDRTFLTIRPNLIYQMLRFWGLSLAYDFSLTDYDLSDRADRIEHRLSFASQFTVRESLFLTLAYRYRSRHFGDGTMVDDDEFHRNEVMLTLTYAPTFLFGR